MLGLTANIIKLTFLRELFAVAISFINFAEKNLL